MHWSHSLADGGVPLSVCGGGGGVGSGADQEPNYAPL